MIVYSKIILILNIFNITTCSGFSIYYFVNPIHFNEGTFINNLAFLLGFFGFFVMMILMAIYYLILGKQMEQLITFNKVTIILYIVFGGNVVYRLFSIPYRDLGSLTPSKVLASLALAMLLNLQTIIISKNYIVKFNK